MTTPARPPCTDGEPVESPRLRVVPAPRDGRIAGTAPLRGEWLLTLLERPLLAIESAVARALPEAVNPLAQPGPMTNALLLIVVATGILLLPLYSPSLSGAHASVAALDAAPYSWNLLRSVHRLASDAALAFILLHALRALLSLRVAGARWIAWTSGIALLAITWLSGWLGYWLPWDERAREVALATARVVDLLPLSTERLATSFLTDDGLSSLLFFVVFLFHVLVPLAMIAFLLVHVMRLARTRFLPGRRLALATLATLVVLSLIHPATQAGPARMAQEPAPFSMDWWYLAPLAILPRIGAGACVALALTAGAALVAAPWWLRRAPARAARVIPELCNACLTCVNDCPYGAIEMVPRGTPHRHATVAQVVPSRCVGCGICSGACEPGGVGLPWAASPDERHLIDAWAREPEGLGTVVFACERIAPNVVRDASTGDAGVEGVRVIPQSCAGQVHVLNVERTLRRGASAVVIATCPRGSCKHRHGAWLMAERFAGKREPEFRHDRVDMSKLHVMETSRLTREDLARIARGDDRTPARTPARRALVAALLLAGLALPTLVLSDLRLPATPHEDGSIVVAFSHPGQIIEKCRDLSPEEIEALPAHMRRTRDCVRKRADVKLRITVDGALRLERALTPGGLWNDGPSVAFESVSVAPGHHRVEIALDEGLGWTLQDAREVDVTAGERRAIRFDRERGFTWQ